MCFVFSTYFIESLFAAKNREKSGLLMVINIGLMTWLLVFPVWATWMLNTKPIPTLFMMAFSNFAIMKAMSFAHVMHNIRSAINEKRVDSYPKEVKEDVLKYPKNLTLGTFAYFIAAPTLVF